MLKNFLTDKELENIKNHKYHTSGYSTLDNKMNPFWEKVSDYIPYVITPNMVTLLGLISLFSPIPIILYFDNQSLITLPNWVYFYMALSVFLGQTFDAIDGKHARKTRRSSPLGQFMDHGCDAFSNSFVVVMGSQAYRLGQGVYPMLIQILVQSTFYIMNWEEYMTGVLCTNVNDIGTTEIQFVSMALLVFPVFDYFDIVNINLLNGIRLLDILILLIFFISVYMSALTIIKVVRKTENTNKLVNGLLMLISPMILFISEYLLVDLSIYKEYTNYIIILNGMLFGYQTSKMILSTMTKSEADIICFDTIVYLLIIVVCHYCPFSQQLILLLFYFFFITIRYFRFVLSIIFQLLNYLHINF